jgi:hypothetical protein
MIYSWLAETVVIFHFAFIVYAIFGAGLAWFWPKTLWLHIPVFLWAGAIMLIGFICPLTPLENYLRLMAGEEGYDGSFIEHYLVAVIYPEGLTRGIQIVLGILVLGWNVACYAVLWRKGSTHSN